MKRLTQRQMILKMLIKAKKKGINSFGLSRRIALQLPARIWELKHREGLDIVSIQNKNGSVNYILRGEIV